MNKLFGIVKKNIKLLLRSKTSALIVILGPLLIILLVGVAFNTTGQGAINVGVFSPKYSELSNSFVDGLKDQKFTIIKFDSKDACTSAIKSGSIHACVFFPSDLAIKNDKQSEIELQIDYTKTNLAYSIQDAISSKVEVKSTQISKDLTQILLNKLSETQTEMTSSTPFMASLSSQNIQINELSNVITNTTKKVDLKFEVKDYSTTAFDGTTSSISQSVATTRNISQSSISESISSIETIKTDLQNLKSGNLSNDKKQRIDELATSLSTLQIKLTNLSSKISSSLVKTEESTTNLNQQLNNLVNDVNSNLIDVRTKFDNAQLANTKINSQVQDIQRMLNLNTDTLNSVQLSRKKILDNILDTQVTNVNSIVSPIKITKSNVVVEKTNLNLLLPSLIIMVIMFISILMSATLVVGEKTSQAHFRNYMSPTSDLVFMVGNFLSSFLILILQSIIIVAISSLFFGISISGSIFGMCFVILLAIILFILLGMLIGYVFNSEETATLAAISLSSIMLFLSGIIIPFESIPTSMQNIVGNNPFVILSDLLKKVMIFNSGISGYLGIIIAIIVIALLAFFVQKLMHRHFLHKYSFHMFRRR